MEMDPKQFAAAVAEILATDHVPKDKYLELMGKFRTEEERATRLTTQVEALTISNDVLKKWQATMTGSFPGEDWEHRVADVLRGPEDGFRRETVTRQGGRSRRCGWPSLRPLPAEVCPRISPKDPEATWLT